MKMGEQLETIGDPSEGSLRSKEPMKIYTLGHSNRSLETLLGMLQDEGVGGLVDVRSRPGSGRFPWFNKAPLERALNRAGIGYVWEGEALGGRRPERPADARHSALENGFRAFASHMETPEFRAGIDHLLELACARRTALLCAEKDPAHCHRALIADYLTVRGYGVLHLVAPGEARRHTLHPAAWLEGFGLVYDRSLATPDLFSEGAA
jgi:uncharacterized protein (DUF488 family)